MRGAPKAGSLCSSAGSMREGPHPICGRPMRGWTDQFRHVEAKSPLGPFSARGIEFLHGWVGPRDYRAAKSLQ
jgi:hypothetical protein